MLLFKILKNLSKWHISCDPSGTRTPNTLISRLSPVWVMFCVFLYKSLEYWTKSANLLVKMNVKKSEKMHAFWYNNYLDYSESGVYAKVE